MWDLFRVVPSKPVADEDTSVTPVEPERGQDKAPEPRVLEHSRAGWTNLADIDGPNWGLRTAAVSFCYLAKCAHGVDVLSVFGQNHLRRGFSPAPEGCPPELV